MFSGWVNFKLLQTASDQARDALFPSCPLQSPAAVLASSGESQHVELLNAGRSGTVLLTVLSKGLKPAIRFEAFFCFKMFVLGIYYKYSSLK